MRRSSFTFSFVRAFCIAPSSYHTILRCVTAYQICKPSAMLCAAHCSRFRITWRFPVAHASHVCTFETVWHCEHVEDGVILVCTCHESISTRLVFRAARGNPCGNYSGNPRKCLEISGNCQHVLFCRIIKLEQHGGENISHFQLRNPRMNINVNNNIMQSRTIRAEQT